jgi:hypothetical protein
MVLEDLAANIIGGQVKGRGAILASLARMVDIIPKEEETHEEVISIMNSAIQKLSITRILNAPTLYCALPNLRRLSALDQPR